MTQDEIIEMAEQAGFDCYGEHITWDDVICTNELKAFAKLAAAKEREACAKLCETLWDTPANGMATEDSAYGNECATAIRAREQK
jgi:hypothetical protein